MYNHAPEGYKCPICLAAQGIESPDTLIAQSDILFKDDRVMALVASYFMKSNEGHVLVVPNDHYENLYDMPDEIGNDIMTVSKKMAMALKKAYKCDGIKIIQNNEPAAGQHAFHYHMHIVPRYENDEFGVSTEKIETTPEERKQYVDKLKAQLEETRNSR